MAKDYLSYEDVYEIAAEVAQETITKFLQNLVKLVPNSEDVVNDIQEQQFRNLRNMRAQQTQYTSQPQNPVYRQTHMNESISSPITETNDVRDDFDEIAHPGSNAEVNKGIFDVLNQIPGDDSGIMQAIRDDK